MAAYLMTGFDIARIGAMAANVNDGTDSGVAELTSGTRAHRDLSAAGGAASGYTAFPTALDTEIDTVLTTHGGGVNFSTSTLRYTLGPYNAAATIDFTSATLGNDRGKRLAAALGFDYNHADATGGSSSDPFNISLSGATSYIGSVAPHYLLELARDGVSDFSRPYEVSGQTKRAVSTAGTAYAIGPTNREQRVRWTMRYQGLATVFAAEATDQAWTYEDLIQHARAWEPILLHTSSLDIVTLNTEGDFHDQARKPVWPNYHGKWNLAFEGQYIGAL